jgi:hypothetical protein
MIRRYYFSSVGLNALLVGALMTPTVCADVETDLLQKFQQQNQSTAVKARDQVERNLAQALSVSAQEPEKALELLRQSREVLDAATALPRADKVLLARKLDDGFRDAKARLESKEEEARRLAALAKPVQPPTKSEPGTPYASVKDPRLTVSPILFFPRMGLVQQQAAGTVTPVVLPDRRWVRISVSVGFAIRY